MNERMTIVERLRHSPRGKTALWLLSGLGTVAGLLLALPPVIAWFDTPEETLVKNGVVVSRDGLMQAYADHKVDMLKLFAKTPVRLEPDDFAVIFGDVTHDPAGVDALMAGGLLTDALCPVSPHQVHQYEAIAADPVRLQQVRRLCGTPQVQQAIRKDLKKLQFLVAQMKMTRPDQLAMCVAEATSMNTAAQIREALRNTDAGPNCVLDELRMGPISRARMRAVATQCCQSRIPEKDGPALRLEAIQRALQILG